MVFWFYFLTWSNNTIYYRSTLAWLSSNSKFYLIGLEAADIFQLFIFSVTVLIENIGIPLHVCHFRHQKEIMQFNWSLCAPQYAVLSFLDACLHFSAILEASKSDSSHLQGGNFCYFHCSYSVDRRYPQVYCLLLVTLWTLKYLFL